MNVRARLVRRRSRGPGMIHDVTGLVEDVGRLRRVGERRLFDHEMTHVQK